MHSLSRRLLTATVLAALAILASTGLALGQEDGRCADPAATEAFRDGFQKQQSKATMAALNSYQRCLEIEPDCVPCSYEIGWSYWVLERWADVVSSWEKVLRLEPGHAEASNWLPTARDKLNPPKPRVVARSSSKGVVSVPVPVFSFDEDWMFWGGSDEPPGWPPRSVPTDPGNGLELLPVEAAATAPATGLSSSVQSDPDRVLLLRAEGAEGTDQLVTEGRWWEGFKAPFDVRSELRWKRHLPGWAKQAARHKRKEKRAYSRSQLIYPSGPSSQLLESPVPRTKRGETEGGLTNMYFLKRFVINDPSQVQSLQIHSKFTKGVRIFINGEEVARRNLAWGKDRHGDFAAPPKMPSWIKMRAGRADWGQSHWSGISPEMLRAGENIISAVVHRNAGGGDPALFFDLRMESWNELGWVKRPYLVRVTKDGVTVSWETTAKTHGWINIKDEAGFRVGRFKSKDGPKTFHEVQVRGLSTGTRYTYEVHSALDPAAMNPDNSLRSKSLSFKTSPTDNSSFGFLLYGDSRSGDRIHRKLAGMMLDDAAKYDINLVIHTGDIVSKGYKWELWQDKFFDPARDLIAQVPFYLTPGNHELNQKLYYDYFDLPHNESWYSFRYGLAEFFSINTNVDFSKGGAQYRWLEAALQKSTATWKIAFFHHPPYACANARKPGAKLVVKHLVPLLEQYGVQLVLLGHDHLYGRSAELNGVTYLISGGGGSWLYKSTEDEKMILCDKRYNYVRFHVGRDAIEWTGVDLDGQVIEDFRILP